MATCPLEANHFLRANPCYSTHPHANTSSKVFTGKNQTYLKWPQSSLSHAPRELSSLPPPSVTFQTPGKQHPRIAYRAEMEITGLQCEKIDILTWTNPYIFFYYIVLSQQYNTSFSKNFYTSLHTWCWNLLGSLAWTGTTLPYTCNSRTIEQPSLSSGRNVSAEHLRNLSRPINMSCSGSS